MTATPEALHRQRRSDTPHLKAIDALSCSHRGIEGSSMTAKI
jgi:hypothetical protein